MNEVLEERYDARFWQSRLEDLVEHYRPFSSSGRNAEYIPALGKIDSNQLGICVIGSDQTMIKAGNWDVSFTLQSISKVISFIAACLTKGISYVLDRVDVEPTGDAFNSIIRLEMYKPGKPFNPMINAGALTVASILPGESALGKMESLHDVIEKMIGKRLEINEEVFRSEWQTAHRNRALAHYLKETGFLEADVEETLEVYLKQCSMEGSTEDIALIGMILANDGYHPLRCEQVIPKEVARLTKALMLTCGMYNASGKFAAFVGIPAKSGVSGGIMCAVPASMKREQPFQHGCGIGIYGPAIDDYGNSMTGGMLLKHIAREWDLSIF
ncbi:glutaminase [Bacillus paralicheniformis]|uniref:glutaminase n=1 Tax=Bacillus paralicheniformis TaxID=1648923 RepID=UPI00227FB8E7|nr:glutaminase [Bacillus paralicheniformis]MCY8149887.1 glutaminase [Bacillus paralicheniformis]MCY9419483.1 glutaminase [Bacillus paralicheniformis]MEC0577903.1 glutaminase [Bacillus paralicheniformis]